ncbi:MAG TPA: bifunctional helix-turn-helix transcriptional regulator/GNAT family N-acetyltransferase [Steroidobacteraceae bacterium]|nr:bifunctional helix-turn-helix transcriptional regulator/GNAT family N-acetyltransferase [Steroidobacteraceae bacterium]
MSIPRDIISERGLLFLGSRLKRLAERMQGDVAQVPERAALAVQPGHYPLLATLDRYGPLTVGELAEAMQISQPAVTRTLSRLTAIGLVQARRGQRDQRHKSISLSAAGRSALLRSKLLVWPQVEGAVIDMLDGMAAPLLEQIAAIESRLAQRSLSRRALSIPPPALSIRDFSDELAGAFRDINVEWIESMYEVEAADLEVLDQPRQRIIAAGGAILFVEAAGVGIIGTCALRKTGEAEFELIKMGVLEAARGLKAGEFLLQATIARALSMGAKLLYLLSNRKSAAAIHLYEKLGFVHDAAIMRRFGARYARCDVAMRYVPPL